MADCYRRCMAYSLYKDLGVCRAAQRLTAHYLSAEGSKLILEELKKLMDGSEPRYLLSRIYLEDYLLFAYSRTEEDWTGVRKQWEETAIGEEDLEVGIAEYENAAE